jgi:pimeloyl-ACP methyl ester carboxylesterase
MFSTVPRDRRPVRPDGIPPMAGYDIVIADIFTRETGLSAPYPEDHAGGWGGRAVDCRAGRRDIAVRMTTRPILAAFLTALTVFPPPAAPAAAARPTGLRWQPCADDRTAQCATLRVPINWAEPYSATAEVAVARRPATDRAHRIGTLVVNPGGPGGSGVDFALDATTFFSAALRARFDIVGFDPRGVARSTPVQCTAELVEAAPSPLPATRRQYDAILGYNRRLAKDCRKRTGPLFGHVDTMSVARDMDALRAALGEETISFYGASYGTLLGEQYAQRYPRRIRALALDSVMDHTQDTAGFLGSETATAQDAFDEFVAWCRRDPACVLHGRDIPALWASLLDRAATGALPDPYDPAYRLTVLDLLGVAFGSFYDPQWHSLAYYLKEAEATGPAARRRATEVLPNSFPAVFCADWDLPVGGYRQLAARLRELRAQAPQMLVSPLALSATVGCLGWPSRADNPQAPLRRAATPTLLINARHDPATPYGWARNVAAQLGPRANLVEYRGWGHVVYGRSACVTSVVDRYLTDLRTPAVGAACAGVVPDQFGVGRGRRPICTDGEVSRPDLRRSCCAVRPVGVGRDRPSTLSRLSEERCGSDVPQRWRPRPRSS